MASAAAWLSSITGEREPHQHGVEAEDLPPVGILRPRRPIVQRGDRRLHRIGRGRRCGLQRRLDPRDALGDHPLVPEAAVLVLQQHDVAGCVEAGWPARFVQQHQRGEAADRTPVWQQPPEPAGEADRLGC
jgi:hypothetical protein